MPISAQSDFSRRPRRIPAVAMLWLGAAFVWLVPAQAQTKVDLQAILSRLERLENQNQELLAEIQELKRTLTEAWIAKQDSGPSLEERLAVQESRTAEHAAIKVETSQRFPIRLTGMALFNVHLNSRADGRTPYPTVVSANGARNAGAGVRQSVLGLDYTGPRAPGNGIISGALRMDLYGGSGQPLDQTLRLRTATLGIDWTSTSLVAGVTRPIISAREPESLARVYISPLSGAGNLWMWLPQVRVQQQLRLTDRSGVVVQAGVVQTREVTASSAYDSPATSMAASDYSPARPGFEARLELFTGTDRRLSVAPGFHRSVTHVAATSVPSEIFSLDWQLRIRKSLEFMGAAFVGQNIAPLGTGGIRQGVIVYGRGLARGVRSRGGWSQLKYSPRSRLWLNLLVGQQDDRNSDLPKGAIGKNLSFGGNFFYRLAPNVLASFEVTQTRTSYLGESTLLNNHYDLALAYLF